MAGNKRATVYFDPEIHRALRLKSAVTDRPISELVNDAVRAALAEDAWETIGFSSRRPRRKKLKISQLRKVDDKS